MPLQNVVLLARFRKFLREHFISSSCLLYGICVAFAWYTGSLLSLWYSTTAFIFMESTVVVSGFLSWKWCRPNTICRFAHAIGSAFKSASFAAYFLRKAMFPGFAFPKRMSTRCLLVNSSAIGSFVFRITCSNTTAWYAPLNMFFLNSWIISLWLSDQFFSGSWQYRSHSLWFGNFEIDSIPNSALNVLIADWHSGRNCFPTFLFSSNRNLRELNIGGPLTGNICDTSPLNIIPTRFSLSKPLPL